MKIGIMQPYFFPYLGYWQLIKAVDTFIVYDKIQYTKKGWINRNRFLQNSDASIFSIPLLKDSDYLYIVDRKISPTFDKNKFINQLNNAYNKAPYKNDVMELIEEIINFDNNNLFEYIYNSITSICKYLEIKTKIIISSNVNYDNNLKAQDKIIDIVKSLNGSQYINAIGGQELYNKEDFDSQNIKLNFINPNLKEYKQFNNEFVKGLSIIDVMMFNSKEKIKEMLDDYEFI